MKRTVKKALCMLLSLALVMSVMNLGAFAAEAKELKQVFKYDFEGMSENENILTSATDITMFSLKHANETGVIRAVKDDTMCAQFFHTGAEDKSSGPKLIKKINFSAVTNLTVRYRFKGDAALTSSIYSEGTNISLYANKADSWRNVEINFDTIKNTYSISVDGKSVKSNTSYTPFENMNAVELRFSAGLSSPGMSCCIDDVEILTTDDVDAKTVFDPNSAAVANPGGSTGAAESTGVASNFSTATPNKISVPSGMNTLLNDDFENYKDDTLVLSQWSIIMGNKTYIKIDKLGDNKVMKYFNTDSSSHGPRVEKSLEGGLKKVYLEFASMNNSGAAITVSLSDGTKTANVYLKKGTNDAQGWSYHKYEFDFETWKANAEIDGKSVASGVDISSLKASDTSGLFIRISSGVNTGGEVVLDNMVIYTPDEINTLFGYDGSFNYKAVSEPNPTGLGEVMKKTHPRVLVTDWDVIREKINTDEYCAKWFSRLKSAADGYLTSDKLVEYKINARGNANDISHQFLTKAVTLGFVTGVTGERKYAEFLLRELRNANNNWPDWGESICIVGSHVIRGFATSYDWAYDVFTASEREEVEGFLLNHAASIVLKEYTGKLANGNTVLRAQHNQAMVGQSSNIALAVAINDIAPNVSEYIFRQIATNLPTTFVELSDDGGFAEPMEYWSYGVGYLISGIATLENCVDTGKTLPDCLNFAQSANFSETPDHMIYYDGATRCFNFNASSCSQISSPILLRIASRYDKPQYAWYEITKNQSQAAKLYNGLNACEAIVYYDPAKVSAENFALDKFFKNDRLYGPNGISMRSSWDRDTMLFAAMQGGDNKTFHSYRGLGTFVIDWEGERFSLQTGKNSVSGTYTMESGYSGSYTDFYHERTEGNNTLTINPDTTPGQKADGFALLIDSDSAENEAYGVLDLTRTRDDLNKWHRGMMMTNNRTRVVIQDEVSLKVPSEIYWFMHTNADITISKDGKGALLEIAGKRMYARINAGPADAVFTLMEIEPLPSSPNPEKQKGEFMASYTGDKKLTIHVNGVTDMTLSVEFIPLRDGEGIPNDQTAVIPMESWSVNKGDKARIEERLGDVVALKLGTPAAYAKGVRTYVDPDNKQVFPFETEGRTLVPVRFISEKFGATVSWTEATQKVDIACGDNTISMVLGSNEMSVNGKTVTLDVPAQSYNDRTLIPLRALVEALGKKVFWDDCGLIIISDDEKTYDETTIADACKMFDIRLLAGEREINFRPEMKNYYINGEVSDVSILTNGSASSVSVAQGNPAVVTIDGENYNIYFTDNPFAGIAGTGGEGAVSKLDLTVAGGAGVPDHQTYITVADVDSSTGWGKYPKWGSVDGVISSAMENRWTGEGEQWISYDLGEVKTVHSFALATTSSEKRTFTLSVDVSSDGINWTNQLARVTTNLGYGPTVFSLSDVSARYIRLNTISNSEGSIYHSYAEVRFYADAVMESEDQAAWNAIFKISDTDGKVGDSLKIEVSAVDSNNAPADISGYTLSFESSDDSVISVDGNGNCTLKKAGSATIKVVAKREGSLSKKAEITINVK